MIRDAISPAKVEVEIKSGDKVYDDEDQVWPAWVDVADATSLVDVYGPDTEQGTGAAKAKTDATMSSQPKGTEAKPEELDVVEEAGVEQAALRVNLDLAEAELRDCKAALDADHLAQADGALRTIQRDGVRFTLSLFESPLFVAFDNLNQAEALLRAKEPEAARIALEASARSLKDYGQEAGKERAKEVDALRAKITKAAGAIDSDEIGQRVHGFAQTVTGWLE